MLPRIILHNAVSVDGRIDGFTPDIGLFYQLAQRWREDATLAGCDTLLAAMAMETAPEQNPPPPSPSTPSQPGEGSFDLRPRSQEDEGAAGPPATDLSGDAAVTAKSGAAERSLPKSDAALDRRPLLVVPDSRGRLRHWRALLRQPYWRGGVALCSQATPVEYVEYLYANNIDCIVWGRDKVDLRKCLAELAERHDVETIRVDSGGALDVALIQEGLVDEVSLLIHPVLVTGASPRFLFRPLDPSNPVTNLPLRLLHFEKLEGDHIWVRYAVIR